MIYCCTLHLHSFRNAFLVHSFTVHIVDNKLVLGAEDKMVMYPREPQSGMVISSGEPQSRQGITTWIEMTV